VTLDVLPKLCESSGKTGRGFAVGQQDSKPEINRRFPGVLGQNYHFVVEAQNEHSQENGATISFERALLVGG
jgi:hypothetical protein